MGTNCRDCKYHDRVPDQIYVRCLFNFLDAGIKQPRGIVENGGWHLFPYNFDPSCIEMGCKGFSTIRLTPSVYI